MKCTKIWLLAALLLLCSDCQFYNEPDPPKEYYFIHEGSTKYGRIAYTYDGKYVREGYNRYGEVIYTCMDGYVMRGYGNYGTVHYSYDGHCVRSRLLQNYNGLLFYYDTNYIRDSKYSIIYTIEKE